MNEVSQEGGRRSDKASYVNMLHMWLWHWKAGVVRMTPLPISTPSHSFPLNVALHSRCFHSGGGGRRRRRRRREEEEGLWSQRERGGLSLFLGSERRKNNWCANGCLSLFLDDSTPLPPSPPFSPPSPHPSFLQSLEI